MASPQQQPNQSESGRPAPRKSARATAIEIIETLRSAGHTAYLAGGCVRDELLGVEPKDFDVATDAHPSQITTLFPRTNEVGAAFGVVLVRKNWQSTEVATFRRDGTYTDRRRPDSVEFSTAEQDAQRRDFTINALFLDPLERDQNKRVIDFVGGRNDLKAGLIQAVGDPAARLDEDHLRALRAVRFACRFGFAIAEETQAAITAHARHLAGVSRERIGEEMRKLLSHPSRADAMTLIDRLGLDEPILGEVSGLSRPTDGYAISAGLNDDAGFETALASAAIDRGLDITDEQKRAGVIAGLRAALCLSNAERDRLTSTFRCLDALLETGNTGWLAGTVANQKRLAAHRGFDDAVQCLAVIDPARATLVWAQLTELKAIGGGMWPTPILDGDDLIELGLTPSDLFARILHGIYDAQLEGEIRDKPTAQARAMELARTWSVQ